MARSVAWPSGFSCWDALACAEVSSRTHTYLDQPSRPHRSVTGATDSNNTKTLIIGNLFTWFLPFTRRLLFARGEDRVCVRLNDHAVANMPLPAPRCSWLPPNSRSPSCYVQISS